MHLITLQAHLKFKIESAQYSYFQWERNRERDDHSDIYSSTLGFVGAAAAPPATPLYARLLGGEDRFLPTGAGNADAKKQLQDQRWRRFSQWLNTAIFLTGSSKLVVKDTSDQMDIIETLIEARSKDAEGRKWKLRPSMWNSRIQRLKEFVF